ncbi:MAG: hypothetical protein ACRED4_04580, partial [Brevundimonas sp.]
EPVIIVDPGTTPARPDRNDLLTPPRGMSRQEPVDDEPLRWTPPPASPDDETTRSVPTAPRPGYPSPPPGYPSPVARFRPPVQPVGPTAYGQPAGPATYGQPVGRPRPTPPHRDVPIVADHDAPTGPMPQIQPAAPRSTPGWGLLSDDVLDDLIGIGRRSEAPSHRRTDISEEAGPYEYESEPARENPPFMFVFIQTLKHPLNVMGKTADKRPKPIYPQGFWIVAVLMLGVIAVSMFIHPALAIFMIILTGASALHFLPRNYQGKMPSSKDDESDKKE